MDEDLKQSIAALTGDMQTMAADVRDGLKTLADEKVELDKYAARLAAIEAEKKDIRAGLPITAPLDVQTGTAAATRGGWKALPLKKALTISPNHDMLQGQDREDVKQLHDLHDACAIKYQILKKRSDSTQAWSRMRSDQDFINYVGFLNRTGLMTQKANEIMHPDSGGVGATLDFTLLSSTMIDKMRLALVIANQFQEITLTRATQKFPTRTADGFGVLGGSTATSPPATGTLSNPFPTIAHFTNPTFSERQFDVKHLLVFMWWNDDMLEDSIVPWLPMMREDISYFAARTLDRAILDGDLTGTHMDTDVAAANANDFRKAWYGLRKMSKANWTAGGSAAITEVKVHALHKSLGIYGKDPARMRYVASLKSMYDLVGLGVLNTSIKTAPFDSLTSTGTITSLWGSPLLISEFIRGDIGVTGVNEASANTFTTFGAFNVDRFVVARHGTVQIEDTRIAPMLTTVLQNDVRIDFGPWDEQTLTSGQWAVQNDVPCNFIKALI